jgi:hypothetical protein
VPSNPLHAGHEMQTQFGPIAQPITIALILTADLIQDFE